MKKLLTSLVLTICLMQGFKSSPAQAFIGFSTLPHPVGIAILVASPILFVGGGVMMVAGSSITGRKRTSVMLAGAGIAWASVFILNNEFDTASFTPLSSAKAREWEISENERIAFNDEIDEVNYLYGEVLDRFYENDTSNATLAARAVHQNWQELGEQYLSAPAMSALEKVSKKISESLVAYQNTTEEI